MNPEGRSKEARVTGDDDPTPLGVRKWWLRTRTDVDGKVVTEESSFPLRRSEDTDVRLLGISPRRDLLGSNVGRREFA